MFYLDTQWIYTITGNVMANRLSEIEDWDVLLLEAGADGSAIYDVPTLASTLQGSEIDWNYTTEPNENYCLGK